MKRWISAGVLSAVVVLIGASFTVAAETTTDPTNDVWHWSNTGTAWSWVGNTATKPNVDITQISATVADGKVTLSMTVSGTIQTSEKVVYWAYYNTTDTTYYMAWTNGTGYGIAQNKNGGMPDFTQNITVTGNTISAVLNIISNSTTNVKIWGWAAEYTGDMAQTTTQEWWGDWAPNTAMPYATNGNTGNTTNGNLTDNTTKGNSQTTKTPGFEIVPVLAAVGIALVLLRRRR
jgi:hypothetical protein